MTSKWTYVQETSKKGSLGCNIIKLDNPASFEHEIAFQASPSLDKAVTPVKEGSIKYNARVSVSFFFLHGP